jgi:folate-binding protein YgfZ
VTADRFQTIEDRGGCVDLSERAKFRLTGADRVRYLNGQVTNDIRKASPEAALHACVVNAKGRIEADVFIHVSADGDALMIDTEPGLREAIAARLERYIVADDVQLEDVTEQWSIVHCFGGKEQGAGSREGLSDSHTLDCLRFGAGGVDIWRPVSSALSPAPCPLLSAGDAETLRIIRGIPRWPHELNPDAFPQEAGLESKVMDFSKGCYIGQEVLSRIKATGKMPKRLVQFAVRGSGFEVEAGMKLLAGSDLAEAKEAGIITSVARHPQLDRTVGLAYVRQAFERMDSLLLASGDPPRILGDVEITLS